jgi:hypothetical protein
LHFGWDLVLGLLGIVGEMEDCSCNPDGIGIHKRMDEVAHCI